MQLFPQLAKARVPALLPSMVAAACLRGPELNALPGVPAALWEREQQRRNREASQRAARGGEGQLLPEEKWREQVNDKWREQVLAAVADLKVAQVGLNGTCQQSMCCADDKVVTGSPAVISMTV
jgi:hypothetical protein